MFAQHPQIAERWAAETPNIKDLPEKAKKPMHKKAADDGSFFESREVPIRGRFFRDQAGRDTGMFNKAAGRGVANAPATQASGDAARADQTSSLNIGATGAPMGGSGFRGAGMGGGMYGTGDGMGEDDPGEDAAPSDEYGHGTGKPAKRGTTKVAFATPPPAGTGSIDDATSKYRPMGQSRVDSGPTKPAAPASNINQLMAANKNGKPAGMYAGQPDLRGQSTAKSALGDAPKDFKVKPPAQERVAKRQQVPVKKPGTSRPGSAIDHAPAKSSAPSSGGGQIAATPGRDIHSVTDDLRRGIGPLKRGVRNASIAGSPRHLSDAENEAIAFPPGRKIDDKGGTGRGFGKRAAASPSDEDANSSLAVGFHRPSRDQPEALELGGERFHSTEFGVGSGSNTQPHGLVEGGHMSVKATSSPQMGKHASARRFLGTSYGLEKTAFTASSSAGSSSGSGGSTTDWLKARGGEFYNSLGTAAKQVTGMSGDTVKKVTTSPAGATLAALLGGSMLLGGGKRLAGGLFRRKVKPPASFMSRLMGH